MEISLKFKKIYPFVSSNQAFLQNFKPNSRKFRVKYSKNLNKIQQNAFCTQNAKFNSNAQILSP